MQRVIRAMRSALPIVQGLLPLLDGNFAGVVSNALTTRPQAPPPPPRLDLEPLEHGLQELRSQQREIRTQLVEQNSSIKRVEDQLEMVREATDRNTLEQQELVEDLKSVGNKMGRYAVAAFALLAMSIAMNVFLYLEFRHLIP
jgi:tRNA/tmRNA/rRNA uracil-C5-methylase (TrmA/RlmC/RlmD family)